MSLLQNEDFLVWQLRTSYLTHIKDGIGERLINVDSSVLNNPSFRATGWTADLAEIKRTYSPPIPTVIQSDYFSVPPRSAGFAPRGLHDDEEEEGGMATGRGSVDTVGPGPTFRRKRRPEQQEEDDSSDLSDESDEDGNGTQRAAQQIKFGRMPARDRAGSSPIRSSNINNGVDLLVTSPSKPLGEGRLRRGSLGAVEAIKQRARRDTATSSDMSSENELDPSLFRRREINPTKAAKASTLLTENHQEDELIRSRKLAEKIDENSAEDSDGTSLSSEFAETADSNSLLDEVRDPLTSSPLGHIQPVISLSPNSPKKSRNPPSSTLQALPPPRPISTIQPVSLLGQAIKAKQSKPKNPIESFARFSGKGSLDPLHIRIYAPFSESPNKPFDMPLQRTAPDGIGSEKPQVIVAEAIGLSLWRYHEESFEPLIDTSKLNVNRWTLRMIEDGEVDYDFPALSRTRPIIDFTSNNNRAARGRSREKPYDEFALVEATEAEYKENQTLTPKYELATAKEESTADVSQQSLQKEKQQTLNPSAPSYYTTTSSKNITPLVDKSTNHASHSTPRVGPSKTLKIHFTSLEAITQVTNVEVTTDTYIAEVLDMVCKRWKLDKAYHILKVKGTNTVAPVDRIVEALGLRTDLDLVRRRFVNEGGLGLAGSPGSSSPNAPLLLTLGTPKKGKRIPMMMQPLAQKQDLLGSTTRYKKYNVTRKQPMSFTPSHQRVLLMDEDYMHILPAESGKTLFDSSAKTSRVPFSMIVGCKVSRRHPKTFRVIIFRERETKRYDFEAQSVSDAAEIVDEITKAMEPFQTHVQGGG